MRILIFFFLVFIFFGFRSSSTPGHIKDFQIFESAIKNKESCLSGDSTLNENLTLLKQELIHSKNPIEIYKAFSKSISKMQSGHTQIHPGMSVYLEWLKMRKSLPFDYFISGKKLISNKTELEDLAFAQKEPAYQKKLNPVMPAYSQILEIDHLTLQDMMKEIEIYISSDENGIDFKYFQTAQMFEFYRTITSSTEKDSVLVKYVYKLDTIEQYYQLGPAPIHSINKRNKYYADLENNNSHSKGFFKQLNSQTAYLRFSSFRSCYGLKYEYFLKKTFKTIQDLQTKNLIIDLRQNTGGAMQYSIMKYFVGEGQYLGTYVIDKSQSYFWDSHIKKLSKGYIQHSMISRLQKRQIRKNTFNEGRVYTEKVDEDLIFKGRIIVITDEGTFSSASILASNLKGLCNAEIIGRRAGGSFYKGNAGSLVLQLPNTKNEVIINPNKFTSHLPPSSNSQAIKIPDYHIASPILPFQEKNNYYIKKALNYIKSNPRPSK